MKMTTTPMMMTMMMMMMMMMKIYVHVRVVRQNFPQFSKLKIYIILEQL